MQKIVMQVKIDMRDCLRNNDIMALCDVTQTLKLQKSSKETLDCKDHPSQSF